METYLSDQAVAFLWAVVLGGGLGGVYDVFRLVRILRGRDRPLLVFLEDLLFALIAALATASCFTWTNFGQVRLFLLAGEGLGFMVWHCTLGVFIGAVARWVARLLRWTERIFGRFFKKFMNFSKKTFIFLKEWVRIRMLKFTERRKSHENKIHRKSKARQKDESRR